MIGVATALAIVLGIGRQRSRRGGSDQARSPGRHLLWAWQRRERTAHSALRCRTGRPLSYPLTPQSWPYRPAIRASSCSWFSPS